MEKIRIGNDIELRWKVYTAQDESTLIPYDLTGRELKASLRCDFGETPVDFRTEENELIAIFRGKDQKALGQYYIILRENDGKDAMKTVDTQEAFELVPRTMDESHSEDGVVRCFHLTFESVVGSWSGTIDPILNHDAEVAEAQRKANEEGRVAAEQARQEASAKAVASADAAAESANIKAEEATNAAISANSAAKAANAAASNADNAAENAQQKAEAASSAAEAATSAAESANSAAENAQQKAQAAQDAAVSANGAASDAKSAAENAQQKAEEANEATISANNATEAANVAAGNAQQQAQAANEAAASANNAATAANAAAENAQQKANEANGAAVSANSAAEAANTAAEAADKSADNADDAAAKFLAAIVQQLGSGTDKTMSQNAISVIINRLYRLLGYNSSSSVVNLELGLAGKYVKCESRSAVANPSFAISKPFAVDACSELLIKTGFNPSDTAHKGLDLTVIAIYEEIERQRTAQKKDASGNPLYYVVTVDESGNETVTTDETTENTGYPVYVMETYIEARYLPNNEDRFVEIPDSGYYVANIPQSCKVVISYKPGVSDTSVIVEKHGAIANLISQVFGIYEHRTMVEAMVSLAARVDALEARQGLLGNATAGTLDVSELTKCLYPTILRGHGVPAATTIPENLPAGLPWDGVPVFIGQLYINLDAASGGLYYAVGHDSVSDWKQA